MADLGNQFSSFQWKPNAHGPQQGALFNTKPDTPHRWPRGFTPERLHEVDEALPHLESSSAGVEYTFPDSASDENAGLRQKIMTRRDKKNPYFTTSDEIAAKQLNTHKVNHFRRNAVEAMSRSTVPVDKIRTIKSMSVGLGGTQFGPNGRAAATAKAGPFNHISLNSELSAHPAEKLETALIHETGHLNDPEINTPRELFVSTYSRPDKTVPPTTKYISSAKEFPDSEPLPPDVHVSDPSREGFAEGFATKHFRADNRNAPHPPTTGERVYDYLYGNLANGVPAHVTAKYHRGIMQGSEGDLPLAVPVASPRQFGEQLNMGLADETPTPPSNAEKDLARRQTKNLKRKRTTVVRSKPIPTPEFLQ